MRHWRKGFLPALVTVTGLACGSSSPTSTSTLPETTADTRTIQSDPSFSQTIQEIFDRRGCTNSACHGTAVSAGLDLRSGSSYVALVNVPATNEPIIRVIPGDADGSYLVIKLEGRQSVGVRMPQTGAALDDVDLTNIRNWISQGAKNN